MNKPIDVEGFEKMFAVDPDPWNYATSRFERYKRDVLMRAVGLETYGRGLELACANGENTAVLSSRCLRLLALDASQTAIRLAEARNQGSFRIQFRHAVLPDEMPRGPFDLIVVSELLYYLRPDDLERLLMQLRQAVAPSGRIVFLHHHLDFDDVSIKPRFVTNRILRAFGSRYRLAYRHRNGRFDAIALKRAHASKEHNDGHSI